MTVKFEPGVLKEPNSGRIWLIFGTLAVSLLQIFVYFKETFFKNGGFTDYMRNLKKYHYIKQINK